MISPAGLRFCKEATSYYKMGFAGEATKYHLQSKPLITDLVCYQSLQIDTLQNGPNKPTVLLCRFQLPLDNQKPGGLKRSSKTTEKSLENAKTAFE